MSKILKRSNQYNTPLRYPGGKSRFASLIAQVIEENNIQGGHYLEPYAGGAGVAIELLFRKVVDHIHINDIDPAINSFWTAVIRDTDNLIKLISDTPINMEQWYYWRNVMNSNNSVDTTQKGFATLFMNRTNRSGILKGGVIGGKNQDGPYKLDERFNKKNIADRIIKIADHADKISIYSEDALTLLKKCKDFLPPKSIIYLDPPYYIKGQGLYRNFYSHEDHVEIAKELQTNKSLRHWVVSYDNAPQICEMYQNCRKLDYQLSYSAQSHYLGNEVMFFSNSLKIPKTISIKK